MGKFLNGEKGKKQKRNMKKEIERERE